MRKIWQDETVNQIVTYFKKGGFRQKNLELGV